MTAASQQRLGKEAEERLKGSRALTLLLPVQPSLSSGERSSQQASTAPVS